MEKKGKRAMSWRAKWAGKIECAWRHYIDVAHVPGIGVVVLQKYFDVVDASKRDPRKDV